jgi:signal transduction histidine kinase
VEDDGPGIPDEKKTTIFHRLKRGQTKAKGMGLGLYIARTLVESFSGKVWVEDRVKDDHSKGSRFVVLLPALEGSNGN